RRAAPSRESGTRRRGGRRSPPRAAGGCPAATAAPRPPPWACRRSRPLQPSCERALPPLHPTRLGRRALVVVAEEVEEPVDQEPVRLASERLAALRRLAPGGIDRDHDVAEEPVGRPTRALALREGEHVGRAVAPAPAPVERAHLAVGDQDDGELGPAQPKAAQQPTRVPPEPRRERGRTPPARVRRDLHLTAPLGRRRW